MKRKKEKRALARYPDLSLQREWRGWDERIFLICLYELGIVLSPGEMYSVFKPLFSGGHRYLHNCNSKRYMQWWDMSTQSREHRPQSSHDITSTHSPLTWQNGQVFPGPCAETCTSLPKAGRAVVCVQGAHCTA